jgi:hypothetical protein
MRPNRFRSPDNQTYCTTCQCKSGPRSDNRNLVVCIDGTSNQFGRHVEPFPYHIQAFSSENVSEYECYRALQQARERSQTINLLRQWNRNIRQTVVEIMELLEASCRQHNWSRNCLVRSSSVDNYRLTDIFYLGTSRPSSFTLTTGSQIIIKMGIEFSFLVSHINCITSDCTVHLKIVLRILPRRIPMSCARRNDPQGKFDYCPYAVSSDY